VSTPDPVLDLMSILKASSETISIAYYQGRIYKTEENAHDIERLKQFRLLSPDIRDAYKLRSSFRQFLNTTLNNARLFAVGANVSEYFDRLEKAVAGHSIAYAEGNDVNCEQYEVVIREVISDIADAIDDDLRVLQAQTASHFAAVSTLAEKIQQNNHYQRRTQNLVNLLETFHFSDIGEQLEGHEELALSFRSLLASKIPTFRNQLLSILEVLNHYLFEFRKIEDRVKKVQAMALHLNRNPTWAPKAWDEVLDPQEWLMCATPLKIASSPDISAQESEEFLAEISRTIPRVASDRNTIARPLGLMEDDVSANSTVRAPESPIRKAVRMYFKEAKTSEAGLSAREWWAANPIVLGGIKEEFWLLRVLAEHDNKGKSGAWSLRLFATQDQEFDGNVLINDVRVSKRAY